MSHAVGPLEGVSSLQCETPMSVLVQMLTAYNWCANHDIGPVMFIFLTFLHLRGFSRVGGHLDILYD